MATDSDPPFSLYERSLSKLAYGLPLWLPEPEGERGEIQIGDVGFRHEGGFCRLFNVLNPEGHPTNTLGVPDHMVPLTVLKHHWHERPEYLQPGPICSKAVRSKEAHADLSAGPSVAGVGGGFSFKINNQDGAILILKDSAVLRQLRPTTDLQTYIRANHSEWYRFITDTLKYSVSREDIIFISGSVKTTEWAVAAFYNHDSECSFDFTFGAGPWASASAGFKVSSNASINIQHRKGPPIPDTRGSVHTPMASQDELRQTGLPCNQAVFLQYYKVKNRLWGTKVMRARAGSYEPPSGPGDDEEGRITTRLNHDAYPELERVPPIPETLDPVDPLLDYILESSNADVAVASYMDLAHLCNGNPFPDDISGFIRSKAPRIQVYDDGLGVLWSEYLEVPSVTQDDDIAENTLDPASSAGFPQTSMDNPYRQPIDDVRFQEEHGLPRNEENNDQQMEIEEDDDELAQPGPSRRTRVPGTSSGDENDNEKHNPTNSTMASIDRPTFEMSQHTGAVTCLACSPNGQLIASGSEDRTIRIWDATDGVLQRTLDQHHETVWSVAFSPNGEDLVSGAEDNLAIIWNVENGEPRAILQGHDNVVGSVTYSPDGRIIATASVDFTARLWDAEHGRELHTLAAHTAVVIVTAFTSDCEKVITGSADFTVRVWNVETGNHLHVLTGHNGVIWSLSISPDNARAISGSDDASSRIWDINNGDELVILGENTGPVWAVGFSPDGARVVSASNDSAVRICDSFTGEKVRVLDGQGSTDEATPAISADCSRVVSSAGDNLLKVWDANTGACVARLEGHTDRVKHMRFTPDARRVVSSSDDGCVRVWDLAEFGL